MHIKNVIFFQKVIIILKIVLNGWIMQCNNGMIYCVFCVNVSFFKAI